MGALTAIYVDPAINANSGTGTSGDPYGDFQYALNTAKRDATNGNVFHIKAGTAEVLAASLTLATYGTPTAVAPLVIRGYTSTAGDGGIGEINCNGVTFWAGNYAYWTLDHIKTHTFGNNNGITGGNSLFATLIHCDIGKGASTPSGKYLINCAAALKVYNCYIHDAGANGYGVKAYYGIVGYNYIYNCPNGIECNDGGSAIGNIIVDCTTTGIIQASNSNGAGFIVGNSIYCSTAATGTGITAADKNGGVIINNIVEGYSGSGGKGIYSTSGQILIEGNNAVYNCATAYSLGDVDTSLGGDATLGSSPFVSASTGNFALNTAVVGAIEAAWPGAWYGPASTTNKADMGAIQNGAGSGGVIRRVARLLGG